jgi:hypothetical protein
VESCSGVFLHAGQASGVGPGVPSGPLQFDADEMNLGGVSLPPPVALDVSRPAATVNSILAGLPSVLRMAEKLTVRPRTTTFGCATTLPFQGPANALAEPAMPLVLGLGLLAAVADPLSPGAAASSLAWLAGWAAAWLDLVARLFAALPGAQIRPRARWSCSSACCSPARPGVSCGGVGFAPSPGTRS